MVAAAPSPDGAPFRSCLSISHCRLFCGWYTSRWALSLLSVSHPESTSYRLPSRHLLSTIIIAIIVIVIINIYRLSGAAVDSELTGSSVHLAALATCESGRRHRLRESGRRIT